MQHRIPPQLPSHVERWSTRGLALWLGVSASTVKYHARHTYRAHTGRWDFNREQAQRVVNRIFNFGHVKVQESCMSNAQSGSGAQSNLPV